MSESLLCPRLDYLPKLPRNKEVPIGCIGSGFIMADCHLVAYRKAGFNTVAIASRTTANAERVAERHGLRAYDTYAEMVASGTVEVVDIAVPPDDQLGVVNDICKHGKTVRGILAQKPLGVNYQQAKQIVELCREAGITLAVNQNMRYDQSI